MSKQASSNETTGESEPLETALEALQSSPEFRGPVEPLDDHEHVHENDHFALIYESQAEQFAAAIPFIRQGLERGERCLYITYENSREDVVAAMRDYGIDVDTALDSGQLSIHDEQETYLRNETFDADETVEFIDAAVEEATEEYEALRITGEMSSVLTEDPEGEELVKCEAKANYLFDEVDGIALCQYNRNEFSADIIRDVISTHPLLIHNDRVSHNVYYTPPEEFFGPEKTEREVNRLLGSLQEQTDAKAELQRREGYLRESYEITSDPALTFDEKLQALFELGCEQFGLTLGAMAKVDPDKNRFEIEYVSTDHPYFEPGLELPLSETYCTAATDSCGVGSVDDPVEAGYDDIHVHEEFGIKAYLGTYIEVEGDVNRTFFFVSEEPRDTAFTDGDHTFQRLMGQWVKYELERRQHERELRERTEHLNALIETTPECIKTVGEDGTLLQMNPAGLDMVEAPEESAVTGENVYDLIAPEHRDRFREFNERICRGARGTLEFDIIGLEGTRRHMESHAAPLERPDGTTVQVALTRDITEQKERKRELDETITELQESEERLHLALEAGEMGTWELDLQSGDSPVRSPQHDRIFGYEEPLDDWSFETFLDHVRPDDRERVKQRFEEAFETGKWDFECWITGADGEQRAISAQGEFHHDGEGEPVRAVGVVRDVTERKRAEEELQKSKEQFRALVTASSDVVYRMSPDWNEMHELEGKNFLSDTDEPTSDWVDKYIHPDDRQRVRDAINEAIRTGSVFELEHRVEQDDGSIGWTFSRAVPMLDEDGEIDEWVGMASDITERKEREAELRRTKNRFETVFQRSNDAMLLFDPEGDEFLEVNTTTMEMLGYDREELLARGLTDLHPHQPEQVRAFLDTITEQGHGWTEELSWRTKDGETIPVEISVSSFELEDRSVMLAVVRDISERKKHERYQRELYEVIADPQASFGEKLDRLLELGRERFGLENGYFNRIDADDHEYEVVEAVGPHDQIEPGAVDSLEGTYCEMHLSSTEPLAVADAVNAELGDLRAHNQYGLEAYFAATVHVGGHEYGTLCFASETQRNRPFTEAERTFLDLMSQCISYELEHRRRERFLHESHTITADSERGFEAKLEELLDLGREWMNLDAAGLTNLQSRDDKFLNEVTIGYGDGTDEFWTDPSEGCYCRQAVTADGPVGMADVRGTDWEDEGIHQEHGLTCYLGTKVMNDATPYGTVWVGSTEPRDREFTETERTFLELIGQWVSYEIEREYRERELKESNERLEQFAYAASHDLQEPLRMVSSYLQLLERRYSGAFDEDGEEYLEFAVDGADRMREMIDGLLAYSRVETRGDPFEPVELDAVLDDVREDLQLQIEETTAEITAEELPCVAGDANQLRQVFQNLLENAITYSGSSSPHVNIEAKRRKQEWVISVHDDGIGIDPDDQDRIFDIFDRLHSRDEYEGTGLGLALCQRIVERHDGEMWVKSEPGEGSTFSFALPVSRD